MNRPLRVVYGQWYSFNCKEHDSYRYSPSSLWVVKTRCNVRRNGAEIRRIIFIYGRKFYHNESRSSRPTFFSNYLVSDVGSNSQEDIRFTVTKLAREFSQVSRSGLYKITTENLNIRKLCSRLFPKLLTEDHKSKKIWMSTKLVDEVQRVWWLSESSQETNPGCRTIHQSQNNNQWNDVILRLLQRSKRNKHCYAARSWRQCLGTDVVFC